jgi:hypothetical protein
MGCRKDKLMMAQQVLEEAVYKIRKEGGGELPWVGAAVMQHHCLQKCKFGIGQDC